MHTLNAMQVMLDKSICKLVSYNKTKIRLYTHSLLIVFNFHPCIFEWNDWTSTKHPKSVLILKMSPCLFTFQWIWS